MKYVLDIETEGLDPQKCKIIGLGNCTEKLKADYRKWKDIDKEKLAKGLLKDETIYHNAKFEGKFFKKNKLPMFEKPHDTMIMANLLNENSRHSLEACCEHYCSIAPWKAELGGWLKTNGFGPGEYDKVPWEILSKYAKNDVLNSMHLYQKLAPMVKSGGFQNLYETEMELVKVLVDIEDHGVLVDPKVFKKMGPPLRKNIKALEKEIYRIVGHEFNINSDKEVPKVLFEELGLPVLYRKKSKVYGKLGNPDTGKDALGCIDHPIIKPLLEYRNNVYVNSVYCEGIPEKIDKNNILRCNFDQMGASTGRFSCSEPNLQDVPKKSDVRKAFICRPGYVNVFFDYSQMEMCVYANFSKDPFMTKTLMAGGDLHTDMARIYWGKQDVSAVERDLVKTLNFAILYGIGIPGISKKFHKTAVEAQEIRNRYREAFPVMRPFNQSINDKVCADGFIQNPFGRRRRLEPDGAYRGVNALVQGSCSDVMKIAMLRIHKLLATTKAHALITIHDELCIELPRKELELIPEISKRMTDFPQFEIPLKVDIKYTTTNWAKKQKWEAK